MQVFIVIWSCFYSFIWNQNNLGVTYGIKNQLVKQVAKAVVTGAANIQAYVFNAECRMTILVACSLHQEVENHP